MNGFVTESYARKGWINRMVSYATTGKYAVGADSANILVKDRQVRGRVRADARCPSPQ